MKTTELAKQSGGGAARRDGRGGAGAASPPRRSRDDPSAEEARVVEGTMADNDTVERRWKARRAAAGDGERARDVARQGVRPAHGARAATATRCASTPRITCAPSSIASRRRSRITSCDDAAHGRVEGDQGREAARDAQRRDRRRHRLVAVRSGQAHRRVDVAGRLVRRHVRVGHQLLHRLERGRSLQDHRREEVTSAASSTSTGACSPPSTRGARARSARSGSSRGRLAGQLLHRARREHRQVAAEDAAQVRARVVDVRSPSLPSDPAHREGAPRRRLRGAAGTPVWATAAGRVSYVGPRGGAGNAIIIDHAGGMSSTYMHLSKFAKGLAVGQQVRQKQVIGYVGMTGLGDGTAPALLGAHERRVHRSAQAQAGARGADREQVSSRVRRRRRAASADAGRDPRRAAA